ncbi:MAG: 16S rRNA (cytidine(1402)-2'-O)-methyltransferase [Cellulomonadaceae bacterium]|jgi:16S rRNA (cytidine1402-2'-O)-methyltransferase|nr:16S rRNA (cytidine(1402)-2'-O)-methyltransferase [Cellulomonadaceae bacterium]
MTTGGLVLAGTPIGNSADASPRLRELLATADIVAAEDTRRVRDLARRLDIPISGRVVSYYEHNEAERAPALLGAIEGGALVLLVTDAGMPAVSDPGYRLVAAAAAAQVPITCAPGPSAVPTALALSGLPSDRFTFEGFLPRKAQERARFLDELATERRTMVFFETPHRVAEAVAAAAAAFGADRPAALCRELTKTYEEVLRLPLGELAALLAKREQEPAGIRGEIVLVVAGAPKLEADLPALVELVKQSVAQGERLKDAAASVAAAHGVSKRELYNAALQAD